MGKVIENADMKAYCHLTDDVILQILRSTDKNLKSSKGIIENVLKRKLYPFVGEERFQYEEFENKDDVAKDIKKAIESAASHNDDVANDIEKLTKLAASDKIIIDLVKLDYGMKDRNPIDKVNFYRKKNPDEAGPIEKKDVSLLLPTDFAEQLVRVYCRTPDDFEEVSGVFERWSKNTTRLRR